MNALPDPGLVPEEKGTERLEQHIKPSVRRAIEMAASLTGMDTSDFVVMAAYEAALKRLEGTRATEILGEDAERFFSALDRTGPKQPTEAMKRAMARYEERVENAIR
mgnify:CR=1 FL=1